MAQAPSPLEIDLTDAAAVIEALQQAAQANRSAQHRRGALAELPDRGRLVMTGDLHDNAAHLLKSLKYAELDQSPEHHLVLHEIMHGPYLVNGRDLSIRTLALAAAVKAKYPQQVLLLQSNHELAQISGEGIVKGGVSVVDAFNGGIDYLYGQWADRVRDAVDTYVRSLLLGVRCANGVFCAHSLPSPRKIEAFDKTIFDREPTDQDLASGGSGYLLVWGRHHNAKVADELAQALGVNVFVLGHQPAEMGYETEAGRILILASDHTHGSVLPIDLARSYDLDALAEAVVPLAAVPA